MNKTELQTKLTEIVTGEMNDYFGVNASDINDVLANLMDGVRAQEMFERRVKEIRALPVPEEPYRIPVQGFIDILKEFTPYFGRYTYENEIRPLIYDCRYIVEHECGNDWDRWGGKILNTLDEANTHARKVWDGLTEEQKESDIVYVYIAVEDDLETDDDWYSTQGGEIHPRNGFDSRKLWREEE